MTRGARRPHVLDADGVAQLGTVIGVWAHPGDETFLSAGLMTLARTAGNRVVVVTATHGERHTGDPSRWPTNRLAELRSDELAAALAVLDVTEHRWLGFDDGCCSHASAAVAIDKLRDLMFDVNPRTVVTFGPDGITGDEDHRSVSQWTAAACDAMSRPPLVLHASSAAVSMPGDRNRSPIGATTVRLPLDDALRTRKAAALRAHASQVCGIRTAGGGPHVAARWQVETFMAAGTDGPAVEPPSPHPSGEKVPFFQEYWYKGTFSPHGTTVTTRDGVDPRPCSCLSDRSSAGSSR